MCLDCASGFHELCERGGCNGCHGNSGKSDAPGILGDLLDVEGFVAVEPSTEIKQPRRRGNLAEHRESRRKKNDMNLKNPQSTGRKRAVAIHGKANPEEPCEWRGQANCGGGRFPILGCTSGVQENLHHGPDKNTLNNERVNIHKICSQCHNRWHTLNDVEYQWDGHHEFHAPREVTEEDRKLDETRWKTLQVKVSKDE